MNTKQLKRLMDGMPSRVRITKNVSYEIVFIDKFSDDVTLGECRYDTKQIVINKNQSNTQLIRTVLHEVIHAIALENNINLTETHVLGLEDGMYRVFKLNSAIAKL